MAIEICLKISASGHARTFASPKTGGAEGPVIVREEGHHPSQENDRKLGPSSHGNLDPVHFPLLNRSVVVNGGEDPKNVVLDGRLTVGVGAEDCEGRLDDGQQHLTVSGGRFYLTPPENGVSLTGGSVAAVGAPPAGAGHGEQAFGFDVVSVNIRKISKTKKNERKKKHRPEVGILVSDRINWFLSAGINPILYNLYLLLAMIDVALILWRINDILMHKCNVIA